MNCQRPVKNEKTNKWEVWDFSYEENGERHYELHEPDFAKATIDNIPKSKKTFKLTLNKDELYNLFSLSEFRKSRLKQIIK